MSDIEEMTDEELNEAIALKQGWLLKTCACGCHDWWMTPDGGVDYNQTDPPNYTHDWRLCGDLLEEMRTGYYSPYSFWDCDETTWACQINFDDGGMFSFIKKCATTPQRAICEAWLAWKELE